MKLSTTYPTLRREAARNAAPPMTTARALPFWMALLPVLLLAVWLGAQGLNRDAIWNDEFYSIHDAGGPPYGPLTPAGIWERVATRNAWHTPGYFIVLSGWGALVGWSPPVLRALSLLAGLLAVAWTYRLGADLVSRRVGLYAALVLAASAFFVHYLHELRMYTLVVALIPFTTWAYVRLVDGRARPWHWPALIAGAAALLYVHYFAALPLVALGLYHLLFVPKTRRWWAVTGAFALAGLLFLPWVRTLLVGIQLATDSEALHDRALSAPQALARLLYFFGNGVPVLTALVGALALPALKAPAAWPRPAMTGPRRIWFFALASIAAVLLTNAVLEIMHEGRVRYLVIAWPFIALVAGLGLARLGRLAPAALAVWLAFGVLASADPVFTRDIDGGYIFPVNEVAAELRPLVLPDDALVQYPPDGQDFWIYARNQEITQFYFNGVPVNYLTARTTRDPAFQEGETREVLKGIGDALRFWLVYDPSQPPSTMPNLLARLEPAYDQCHVQLDRPYLRIELYSRLPVCCLPSGDAPPPRIEYDQGIAFAGLVEPPVVEDDFLPVVTTWLVGPDVPRDVYSVALHLTDAEDNLVAQADFGLPHLPFACKLAKIPLDGVTAGSYTLSVIVYRWRDGARLVGRRLSDRRTGELLPIAEIEVP